MRIPVDLTARHALYRNVIRTCEKSRNDRASRVQMQRTWMLTGCENGDRVRYNKLLEHSLFSSAYIYAPDAVRFGVALPPRYGDLFLDEEGVARDELHRLWHDTDIASAFTPGVLWAHAYDTVVYKTIVRENRPALSLVPDPSDIGVWREDMDSWGDQDAIVHWYLMDLAEFERVLWLRYPDDAELPAKKRAEHRVKREEMMNAAEAHSQPGYAATGSGLPAPVERMLILSAGPLPAYTNPGGRVALGLGSMGVPQVSAQVVKLAELWIKDDAHDDYRVVTNFLPTEEILWDPLNPLVPGQHCFHPLSIGVETPGYLWNIAPNEWLIAMTAWHEDKIGQLDFREELELDPPLFFEGMNMLDDEKAKAFRRPGGTITSGTPGAKVTPVVPHQRPDPFGILDRIDVMFARMGGLPRGNTGETGAGVRSGEQAKAQAELGGGPTLVRAMAVEDCIESIATYLLKLHRRTLGDVLRKPSRGGEQATPGGEQFLLAQMPSDLIARVWAHSQSPLYAEKIVQKAILAKREKAITAEELLDYLDLPMTELLKANARKLARAEAEKGERVISIKEAEAQAKVRKSLK